jgi:Flp pilus assembly protein TadD
MTPPDTPDSFDLAFPGQDLMTMDTTPQLQRLQRLLGYLAQDPANDLLRRDAIEHACDVGDVETARRLLDERAASGALAALPWGFLSARVALAHGDVDAALHQWDMMACDAEIGAQERSLAASAAAQLRLRRGGPEAVTEAARTLAPFIEGVVAQASLADAAQAAWLRVEHHARHLREGLDWALAREAAGQLGPEAAGVASLIAMDANDVASSSRLSRMALATLPEQGEALVSAAALSLVEGQPQVALTLNERLTAARPADGRAWTQLGAARLLTLDLQGARVAYARATELMPGHAGSWHGLAWTMLLLEDLVEAERLLDQALVVDRNFAETHGALAVIYARTGRRAMANDALRRSRGLDPNNFAAQYAQALLDHPELPGEEVMALASKLLDGQQLPSGQRASSLLRMIRQL